MENVIIIGSGPAAHTATIYAARANLMPLMFEGMMAANMPAGGQLMVTTLIENFPGFEEGIQGPLLMAKMREQVLKCCARIETKTVDSVDFRHRPLKVFADGQAYETKAVIVATGATAKLLGIPGEDLFWQRGISACAVCDGALPIFRNKVLAVIGGGDSALEEALHLAHYASKVLLIVRRDVMRASKAMQKRLLANLKIEVIFNTVPVEALGEKNLTGLKVRDVKTNEERVLPISGLFYAIGHTPNTEFLGGQLTLDEDGYIKTQPGTTHTNIEGIFAAGDVQDKRYRQAITASGSGCMAALDAERYLNEHP